ncbi:MAG: hypothetical protein GY719_23690, partial [bacterium]|nr:hypothetical protein [bacterium]
MAKFQGFQVSTPSFAGAGNTSGGFNASGVFLQLMRARENRQRSAQYRQGQIETDERAKQRMLMSHDLQRTRSRELEQRKNQREQERAATVMEERTELLGDYFEALQDTARSPIQRKKQPLRYMDRSTSALNDEELESHLLA